MKESSIIHSGIKTDPQTRGYHVTREDYAVIPHKDTLRKNIIYIKALEKVMDRKLLP